MRRAFLIVAFAVLVILDIMLLPLAFLTIFAGAIFAFGGIDVLIPITILFLVLGGILVGLTLLVGRALFAHPDTAP